MPGVTTLARAAWRAAPLASEAYKRWQRLTPEEKERYAKLMREYAERGRRAGRDAYARVQGRRGPS